MLSSSLNQAEHNTQKMAAAKSPLDTLDSGDVLLFDRRCLAMWHPLSTTICSMAKLSSRYDHVGIVFRINEETIAQHPALQKAIGERSPRGVYCLEANLNGITIRSLEARLERSSSNAIAVRKLQNVTRDAAYHTKYIAHVEKLLGYRYRDQITDLVGLALDPPDKAQEREKARQLLKMRAQLANIRAIRGPDGGMLHDSAVLLAAERKCLEQYNEMAKAIEGQSFDMNANKTVVCSEVVASSLQASGVLAPFPSYSAYLPRDFEDSRSGHRLVFSDPAVSLGETIFLSGGAGVGSTSASGSESDVAAVLESAGSMSKDSDIHKFVTARSIGNRQEKKDMTKPLLQISQAYLLASLVTCGLMTHQTRLQLRWANFSRGGLLSFSAVAALRIATAASLHVQLAKVFDGDIKNHFTASTVDLGHPFYDLVFRGGALGFLAFAMTYPIELLNIRFHFCSYRQWYRPGFKSALAPLLLSFAAGSSYCGMFCWPMFYETIVPCVLPLAPSYFRGETRFENLSDDEVNQQQRLGLKMALGMCALQQMLVYPLETMRLRFALDGRPMWRNPYLGFKHGVLRGLVTGAITYYAL